MIIDMYHCNNPVFSPTILHACVDGRSTTMTVINGHNQSSEHIYLALGRATGDNPFLACLSSSLTAAASKSCKDCCIVGNKVGGKGSTRFGGWSERSAVAVIEVNGSWQDESTHLLVDADRKHNDLDGEVYVTHEKHDLRRRFANDAMAQAAADHPPCSSAVLLCLLGCIFTFPFKFGTHHCFMLLVFSAFHCE